MSNNPNNKRNQKHDNRYFICPVHHTDIKIDGLAFLKKVGQNRHQGKIIF